MVEIDGDLSPILEDRAVSPVIGVLLMVGIVVALAVVVFDVTDDLGESTGEVAPQAQLDFELDGDDIVILHDSGETLNDGNTPDLELVGDQNWESELDGGEFEDGSGSIEIDGSVSTGDEILRLDGSAVGADAGDELQVVWVTADGQTTQELGSFTVPDNL